MSRKDYYLVLGVPREESFGGLQAAFRESAKRYHPDRAGNFKIYRRPTEFSRIPGEDDCIIESLSRRK